MSLGVVDRYELLALIGEGSFGGVYRVRHIHTGQVHALKLAREALDPEGAARVLAEARAAASLRHPHVVGVIDGGVAATGESFIVMELLEGSTLAQLIAKEGPLPPARATRIARQMLDGLAAAHANGIVHRDVKPSNVFITMASDVTGGDMVKVIDFGISKVRMTAAAEGNLTLPGVAMGTPGYMAPEQLGDARSVDPRADVYAVGATLFEMLTMRPPIQADSFETWMRRLRTEPAPLLATIAPHVPPALAAVVDRALARDPDARWPSAAAMRDALDLTFPAPQDGYGATVLDTPRGAAPATFPSTPSAQVHASAPPPFSPQIHASAPPPFSAQVHASAPPPFHASAPPPFSPQVHASAPPPMAPTLPMTHAHPAFSQPPPPAYAPARSSGGSLVPWLLGALVLLVALGVVVGAGALLFFTRASAAATGPNANATATVAATATAAPVSPSPVPPTAPTGPTAAGGRPAAGGPSPPAGPKPGAAPGAAPVPPPAAAPVPAAPDAPAKVAGSVRISPPQVVGELRQDAFMTLAGRARPAIDQCNPDRRALVVKVDVMIGNKKITIAQPSVNASSGDPAVARCVAQSLRDAQFAGFTPGDSGIYKEAQFSWQ